jgi:hypothetical protein
MEAPVLKFATVIAALVATSAFASTAEARGGGVFFATWLRHAGEQQAHERWEESHRSPHESNCDRKKRMEIEAIQAEQAQEAAAQAGEAKRARALALQRQQAERMAAAKRARAIALQQKEAIAAKQTAPTTLRAPAPAATEAASKGDMLPAATTSSANITTASLKTAVADQSSSPSNTSSASTSDVCRKYSPAADGLIEVPCK